MSDAPKVGNAAGAMGLSALFVLVAANGEKFWAGMLGAWKFLLTISTTAPLGVGAFFAALTLAVMVTIACRRFLPPSANPHKRAAGIELLAIGVAMLVAFTQLSGLPAVLVGGSAGLSASIVARLVMAVATWLGNLGQPRA